MITGQVKKRITQLEYGDWPLDGRESFIAVQNGMTKQFSIQNAHGEEWWSWLKRPFHEFKSADSAYADNADTVGEARETPEDLHDAALLTGSLNMDVLPEDLGGREVDTADWARTANYADSAGTLDDPRNSPSVARVATPGEFIDLTAIVDGSGTTYWKLTGIMITASTTLHKITHSSSIDGSTYIVPGSFSGESVSALIYTVQPYTD